jgi:CheY-like chemotaxis protein
MIDETVGTSRILIVDDNDDFRDSLAAIVRLLGHSVMDSGSVPEALEKGRAFQPAVIFMDIGLPGMDGYTLARELRATEWAAPTWIVALTGWTRDSDREKALAAGCDEHVSKPLDMPTLRSAIERGVQQYRARTAN